MVNPNPLGPLLTMMGGFRQLMRGDTSLHGETSLEEVLLDHPGDCRDSSECMIKERFVVDDDLTIDLRSGDKGMLVLKDVLLDIDEVTSGLGVLGRTEGLGVPGRLFGLTRSKVDFLGKHADFTSRGTSSESSELKENLGSPEPSLL